MKSLAGTWKATVDMGGGPMPVTAQYRVTSGGSAVEERLFADTPKEMITIYHDRNGKLALTHYCMLCNRPAMTLVKSDGKSLSSTSRRTPRSRWPPRRTCMRSRSRSRTRII